MKNLIRKTAFLLIVILLPLQKLQSQTFTEQTAIALPGVSNGSASWGDYDNDGDPDLLLSGKEPDNTILLKVFTNGGGSTLTELVTAFSPEPDYSASWSSEFLSDWFDFNNDNLLDIITSGPASTGNQIVIYRNNGFGTFTSVFTSSYLNFQGRTSFDCGDYDNDGDVDILLSNSMETKIIKNKGAFSFADVEVQFPALQYSSSKWLDYDNDGDLDFAIIGQYNWNLSSFIFRNEGYDSFTQLSGDLNMSYIDKGDYDNDGLIDILISGTNGLFKNNGNNTFSQSVFMPIGPGLPGTGRLGDFDNDGDNDAILTGGGITKLMLNNGNGTFSESSASFAGLTESFVSPCDFDNDGDLDIIIAGTQDLNKVCKLYKNGSTVSNPVPDTPTGVTSTFSGSDVVLSWNAVTNDNTPAAAMSYNLIVGTTSDASDVVNPNSSVTGYYRKAVMGNGQLGTTFVLRNLKKSQTYYWKVQAIDNSFRGGAFSSQASFIYTPSIQSYGLNVQDKGAREATLAWTRGNWANCIVFMKAGNTGTLAPAGTYTASTIFNPVYSGWACVYKGTGSSVHVTGLSANTNYLFQVFEYDGGTSYCTQTGINNPYTFITNLFTEINANLQPVANYALGYSQLSTSYWFDSDNDGDLDLLLLGTSQSYFYRNDGSNVFTSLALPFGAGYCASLGDYDNDGYVDIIINLNTGIYRNNHNNTFSLQPITIPQVSYGPVAWNDYDNDGDLDFVISGDNGFDANISMIMRQNADGSFTNQELIAIDQVGYGLLKWGDYDNDGLNDLVISGGTNEAVEITSLYRNNGNGNFSKQISANLQGATSSTMDWADYDGDGDQDLLIGDFGSTKLYRNNGNNTFTEQGSVTLIPTGYGTVQWGDYDNDGDPDILLAGFKSDYRSFTKIYRNNGDNTFTEDANSVLPGAGFGSATFGDYDNDNDLDIIVEGIDADKSFSKIFRNDISTANVKPPAPGSPTSLVIKSDATLKWRSVRTDNTPYKSMSYNLSIGTVSGSIDVMSPHSDVSTGFRRLAQPGNAGYDTVFYLKSLPFGTYYWKVQAVDNSFAGGLFSTENSFQIVPVQASNLSASIVSRNSLLLKWERGNGDRCVVFCKQASTGTASPVNNTGYIADSEFGYGGQVGSSGWYCVYNGREDSVKISGLVYGKEYSFHVFEYSGSPGNENYFTNVVDGNPGVFTTSLFSQQTGILLSNASYDCKPVWGDYDNDGDPDLLFPGFPSKIYKNNGDNTFTELALTLPSVYHGAAMWGDYDNDNDLDFIISGATVSYPAGSPVIKLFRNDGSDIFTEQANFFQPVFYCSFEWYDYNGDGYLDLLMTGATGTDPLFNPVTKLYRNYGDGLFIAQSIAFTGIYMGMATFADYDNDGDPDLVLGGVMDYDQNHNTLKIYRNDGNNLFTLQTQPSLSGVTKPTISWGDCDNDGDPDLLVSTYSFMKVYRNGTNNQFSGFYTAYYAFQDAACAVWCDYDNDGSLDIISTRSGLNTEIYRNITETGGSFNRQDDEAFASTGYRFISPADYDNDGDVDFVLSKMAASIIFRNNLVMKSGIFKTNIPPGLPEGLSSLSSPQGTILKWDPAKDDHTPEKTIIYNIRIGSVTGTENLTPSNSGSGGFRRTPIYGNAFTDTTFLLKSMPAGTYYWKVQAIDQNYKGGAWSPESTFEVRNVQAFFSATEVCNGKPTTFTDESVATAGITAWKWNFSDGTTSALRNPLHTFTQSGIFNVKLVVTDGIGKKDSVVHVVNVRAKPVTAFDAPSVCEGTAVTITNNTNANGLTVSAWSWNFGDASTSASKDPAPHPYLSLADYNISLKAVATNGCADSVTKVISVVSRPVAAITVAGSPSFCEGKSVTLSATQNPEYTYLWRLDGTDQTGGSENIFTASSAGNYTVEITNPRGNCLSTSAPVNVVVKPSPMKPVLNPDNYTPGKCPGENPVKLGMQNFQGYNYRWIMNGILLPKETSSYIEFYEPGNFRLIAELNGCTDTSAVFSAQFPQGPEKPVIYAEGSTAWYLACSIMNPEYHYKWYYNGSLIPDADKYYYMANRNLGIYMVSVGDENGCYTKSDSLAIPLVYTDIDDSRTIDGLNVYPNPSNGIVFIELENNYTGKVKAEVFTPEGKKMISKVFEKPDSHFRETIDMSGQTSGIYVIRIGINGHNSIWKILVK